MEQCENILEHIDNIEQDFRILDNIFKCIDVYWKGEGALAVKDLYTGLLDDISEIRLHLENLKSALEGKNNV